MLPGYNTNGFAHHRLEDALQLLAELGYRSVALTLDYHALDPYRLDPSQVREVKAILRANQLRCVIETGARFLLDPWRKHQPTLLSTDPSERNRRLEFLTRSLDLAVEFQADAVSFWAGTPEGIEPEAILWSRLVSTCQQLCEEASYRNVRLAFEPEPGMFIDTMDRFARLHEQVGHPLFGLTLDLGHLHCQGELPVGPIIERWSPWLWNLHVEDMKAGVHDHLMFGEGEMDFPPIFASLRQARYGGGLHVELSRHSHNAVATARRARQFLARHLGEPNE